MTTFAEKAQWLRYDLIERVTGIRGAAEVYEYRPTDAEMEGGHCPAASPYYVAWQNVETAVYDFQTAREKARLYAGPAGSAS